jgi:LmbE family N-acetylglucosaminyl deacetylase
VLVVAPHPDDELIGAGGTLLQHRELRDPIRILVMTDGVHGDVRSEHDPATYRRMREEETREAARRLGAESVEFFGFPDGARARREDLGVIVPRLIAEFSAFRPDVVYAPHEGEIHPDHHATAVAVREAVASWTGELRCFGYEIWAPLEAELVVDITAEMAEKQDICGVYRTQLEHGDLLHYFTGMNGYRSLFLLPGPGRYAEAFREFPRGDGR